MTDNLPPLPEPTAFLVCKGSEVTARAWNCDEMRAYARAALAQAQSLPDGWKLVPVEPTEAMMKAAHKLPDILDMGDEYRAMLAASPAQPVQPSDTATALHEVRAHLSHINKLLDVAVPVTQAKPEQAAQPECTCLTGGLGPHYCERHSP